MPVITEVVEGDEIVTYSREDVLDATAPQIEVARRPMPPADVNRRTIESQGAAALTVNQTYLAVASPTNTQNLAQIRALTRQNQGLIRLLLERLESAA